MSARHSSDDNNKSETIIISTNIVYAKRKVLSVMVMMKLEKVVNLWDFKIMLTFI